VAVEGQAMVTVELEQEQMMLAVLGIADGNMCAAVAVFVHVQVGTGTAPAAQSVRRLVCAARVRTAEVGVGAVPGMAGPPAERIAQAQAQTHTVERPAEVWVRSMSCTATRIDFVAALRRGTDWRQCLRVRSMLKSATGAQNLEQTATVSFVADGVEVHATTTVQVGQMTLAVLGMAVDNMDASAVIMVRRRRYCYGS